MIYAAELERHCLPPGARCPPAAYFFTSFARVPGGRLLTEQLLQMDLKLDFTFNSCCCCCCCCPSSACAAASLLSLCLNTDQVRVRLGNLLFFCFYPSRRKSALKKFQHGSLLCILSQFYSKFPASPNDGVCSAHSRLCFPSAPRPAVCRYGLIALFY